MLTFSTLNYVYVSEQPPISLNITTLQGPGYHIGPGLGLGSEISCRKFILILLDISEIC